MSFCCVVKSLFCNMTLRNKMRTV
uniref:Uncharacterized protein n=1 Tax=Anguilla anguilla TaxID=7936 RepID=A0A0E9TC04_ANGAN